MHQLQNSIAALGAGKGGGKGKGSAPLCYGCGKPGRRKDQCPVGPGKGQGIKGKGKGESERKGWSIWLEYQRTGKCSFKERTGRPCGFVHVKVPPELQPAEGLVLEDAQSACAVDGVNARYTTMDEGKLKPDLVEIVAAEIVAFGESGGIDCRSDDDQTAPPVPNLCDCVPSPCFSWRH